MSEKSFQGIKKKSPFIAWIHNISLNQQKYMNSKIKDLDIGHDIRYVMFIYDNPDCSQEDIVNMFAQSKGNIAKVLRKLEDKGYIKREIIMENRRKYKLSTTEKGNQLIPKYREISREWEEKVGISDHDIIFKRKLMEIAVNGMKLIEE